MNDPYAGALYYDPNSPSGVMSYDGGGERNVAYASDGTSEPTYSSYSTGGGTTAPTYNPQDAAYLDQQQSLYQRLLGDVDKFQGSGLRDLNDSYQREKIGAEDRQTRANRDYDTQLYDSRRGKEQSLNKVDTNSRTLNDSLRKILGMAGGTGSSAFQYAAPNAVAKAASGERSGVMDSYGTNERNLATARLDTETEFEKLLKDLARQKQTNEQGLRTGLDTQRQGINESLGQIAAERASMMGGNPLDASAQYRTAWSGLQDNITNYPNQFRTAVTPKAVNPQAVSLKDYIVDRQAINANNQGGSQSPTSPYSYFLNKEREEEQRV